MRLYRTSVQNIMAVIVWDRQSRGGEKLGLTGPLPIARSTKWSVPVKWVANGLNRSVSLQYVCLACKSQADRMPIMRCIQSHGTVHSLLR